MPCPSAASRKPRPHKALLAIAARAAGALGAMTLAVGGLIALDAQAQPPAATSSVAAPVPAHGAATKAAAPSPKSRPTPAKPVWTDLTAAQQAALRPLAQHWNGLSEAHKRKWLVLSRNYNKLSADEQVTLHGRMAEWASLSARDRARARLNFAEVKRLAPADERKAMWEAYQALSEEERRKLAASAAAVPTTAALPLRPVPERKLAPVPDSALGQGHGGPRIQLAPPRPQAPLLAPVPPSAEAMYPPPAATPAAAAAVPAPAPAAAAPTAASDPAPAAQ
ncbi:MAG: DUF3106 domain-containing protein [Proteobacteria bacterium]|nr:DUF3106 domain-containing protein [Pseudomonadota bacterium]